MALLLAGCGPRAETALWHLPSRSGASLQWTWVLSLGGWARAASSRQPCLSGPSRYGRLL